MENRAQTFSRVQEYNNAAPRDERIMKSTDTQQTLIYVKQEHEASEHNQITSLIQRKKKYSVISQQVREKFISRVLSKQVTIKEAAKEFGLKFSTSKAILQTFKKEGRIGKKKKRTRKAQVVNVVLTTINPLGSGIISPISINLKNRSAISEMDQSSLKLNLSKDALAEKNININSSLNRCQKTADFLKLQQRTTPTGISLLNPNYYAGTSQPISGLSAGLLSAGLQHKLLLDSVLQGSNANILFSNQMNQHVLRTQNTFYQSEQVNFLQKLNNQSQCLAAMNGFRTESVYNPSSYGLFGASMPQNGPNLSRSMVPNLISLRDYQNIGSFPTKRVCFGDVPLSSPNFF